MAQRRQADGEQYIEADNGFGWIRGRASATSVSSGLYTVTIFGITYELEKRRRNARVEPGADTGWYLYSRDAGSWFFGEWCGRTLLSAIDEASKMIAEADLRGGGYERKGQT